MKYKSLNSLSIADLISIKQELIRDYDFLEQSKEKIHRSEKEQERLNRYSKDIRIIKEHLAHRLRPYNIFQVLQS